MSESEFTCQDFKKCINSEENNKNSFTVAFEENSKDDFTVTSKKNYQNGFTVTSEENSQEGFTIDDVAFAETFASAQFLLDEGNDDYNYEEDNNYENSDEDINEEVEQPSTQNHKLTLCIIIDITNGKIKCCNTKSIKDNFLQLGICLSYFVFNQNQLHNSDAKQSCSIEKAKKINENNVQVSCIRIFKCLALTVGPIMNKSSSGYCACYICSQCFQIKVVEESYNQKLKNKLLLFLVPSLQLLNNNNEDSKVSQVHLPKKYSKITSEKATIIGENMKKEILSLHLEIQLKRDQLENPVLENITNNGIINYPLFGEFTIISNLLMLYETVLNTTLEKNKNELEIEDIYLEIIKQIPSGCYILVNVVILEPGDPLNCNINVYNSSLETYDVKFIKQNIFGNLTDQETIMQKIKAAQCERDHLSMLLAKYTDDVIVNQNAYSIQFCKDSLWSLVAKLISKFKAQDKHELFKGVSRINEEGFKKILACYESGKSCLKAILRQNMCKTEQYVVSECSA
ncbi:20860_t:CDS:2 [Cetraspora pellucida]|uniref:20860_t:CDS:1 n=1 Tax=Cetraspora pellucida TaxID=1433469 RepID=A0A9N9GI76_9GLOM|nr:20860_t:CDS:2 [Cetraspora pellucida]